MKHLLRACVAVLAIGVVPASAADLRMPAKAPPIAPVPAATWTGCYLGANIGGGWARERYIDPLAFPPAPLGSHTASGVVGGGQVGCDYQFGNFVIGARGMFDGADLTGDHVFPLIAGDIFRTHIPWLATATARIGYAVDPSLLLYINGGGAWKREEETKIDAVTLLTEGVARVNRSGGLIGGGFAWRFWGNFSFFAEYNHMWFGSRNVIFTAFPEPGDIGIPPPFPLNIKEDVSMVVAGVNWRFGMPFVH